MPDSDAGKAVRDTGTAERHAGTAVRDACTAAGETEEMWKIPLRTHIIRPGEDIVDVVARYTRGIAAPGDIVCIAESALAIAQGRAVQPHKVRPGLLARFLCRFPDPEGSLATPAAMEMAIREAGTARILLGAAAAAAGRLLGRRGDFFRVAGRHLAQIDDIGGTLPPYDDYIVLGPAAPDRVVARIKKELGIDALVADVNDMRRADILACSAPCDHAALERLLADNPFGNDDQQTPLVLLKPAGRKHCSGGK